MALSKPVSKMVFKLAHLKKLIVKIGWARLPSIFSFRLPLEINSKGGWIVVSRNQ
jgi:hypothetical protein